jgi:hypothetical protein
MLLVFTVCYSSTLAFGTSKAEFFVGMAYESRDQKTLVYKEEHYLDRQNGKVMTSVTKYFDPNNQQIAILTCDYTNPAFPYLPNSTFMDMRHKYREVTMVDGNQLIVKKSEDDGQTWKSQSFPPQPQLVASQGINYRIVDSFSELRRGENVAFDFVFPSRLSTIGIRLRKIEDNLSQNDIKVRFEVDNFLLRLVVPYVETTYDLASQRLVSYSGNSNLTDGNQKSQQVFITYDYSKTPSL